jgi:hypothetical protein
MKRALKWLAGLFLLGVVLFVIFLLSLDTILRHLTVQNIRQQTGMTATIGEFHLGLLKPVITIKDLKLKNPAGFGDTPLLDIPEIHVEYDRAALKKENPELHLTLVRFNLRELDIVKNQAGKTNLFELGVKLPNQAALNQIGKAPKPAGQKGGDALSQRLGVNFTGVDIAYISIGTAKYIDLAEPSNNREQNIGIENQVLKNVKQPADLVGLALQISWRSGDFFTPFAAPIGLQ